MKPVSPQRNQDKSEEAETKLEIRSSKSETMSNVLNSKLKTRELTSGAFWGFLEIGILSLFRISKFELRISEGKLDQFVNLDRKSTRLNSSHPSLSRMPSSA